MVDSERVGNFPLAKPPRASTLDTARTGEPIKPGFAIASPSAYELDASDCPGTAQ